MQAAYLQLFTKLVDQVIDQSGLCLPIPLRVYTTAVMAEYCDKPDPSQGKTFAELYLTAETDHDCKTVGDAALLVYGAFPHYRKHRGMTGAYYRSIGESAYSRIHREPFQSMTKYFGIAATLIQSTVAQAPVSLLDICQD